MRRRPPPELAAEVLARAGTPAARALVEKLVAPDARTRMRGLDALTDVLFREDATDRSVLPCALALATHRGYPESSALLSRLVRALAAIDDPPRSGPPSELTAAAGWDAFRAELPRLVRYARSASDPQAARAATLLASRFAEVDVDTEPLLIALLSGAPDSDERARLLYALARVQASRGASFHASIAEALAGRGELVVQTAVALAVAEHDPPLGHPSRSEILRAALDTSLPLLRARLATVLRTATELASPVTDPRSIGRSLPADALARALERLADRERPSAG